MNAAEDGFDGLKSRYLAYVDTFRAPDGRLGEMLELKLQHTMRVVENATLIADGERFDAECRRAALAAALLHDTGRYEQLTKYDTFNDAESIDHAVLSTLSSSGSAGSMDAPTATQCLRPFSTTTARRSRTDSIV